MPPPWTPLDVDAVRRFEDLGVDRLVVMRDFADMAGGPDEALRAAILDDMAAVAERFSLPEETDGRPLDGNVQKKSKKFRITEPSAISSATRPRRSPSRRS